MPEIRGATVQTLHHLSRLKLPFAGCIRFQWLIGWDIRKTGLYPIGYSRGLRPGMKIFTDLLATFIGEDNNKMITEKWLMHTLCGA